MRSRIVRAFVAVAERLFSLFETLYDNPRALGIVSLSILLGINLYFSLIQIVKKGFIEGDMWFYAYRIEDIARTGFSSLFWSPNGVIDVHPPLYYVITVPLRELGLSVPWIAFLIRIIVPVAVVYFTYKTADLLFGPKTAAVACFFLALTPPNSSFHGLWTSTPSAVSLVPFMAGIYCAVKFSHSSSRSLYVQSLLFFLLASLTHLLTAFASLVFVIMFLFFFRNKIPRWITLFVVLLFALIAAYGIDYFSFVSQSRSLQNIIMSAFSSPSQEKQSVLRQFFFIAYWPRHFTMLTCISFTGIAYYFYKGRLPLRAVDKAMVTWMIVLVVYSQLFLVGIYLANQRFLLYLLFPLAIYGAAGFEKIIMPFLRRKNEGFFRFLFLCSILLFTVYQTGIALCYFPTVTRSSDTESLLQLKDYLPPDATVYVQNWYHSGRYQFAYVTGCDHVLWDIEANTAIGSPQKTPEIMQILKSAHVEYLVLASQSKADVYIGILQDRVTIVWTDGQFYLLHIETEVS